MNTQEYQEKCNPEKIRMWLAPYTGHEHIMDIKTAPCLEKYLAVAPDIYVMAAMLQSILSVTTEQKEFGEYGLGEEERKKLFKPYNELTEDEKTEAEMEKRKIYMTGLRAGRDSALVEMANRVVLAARQPLDDYRLENPEYQQETQD